MAEAVASRPVAARTRRRRVDGGPPEWLWWGSIAIHVGCALLLTSYSFYFIDDFQLLGQAHTQSFGLGYLRENLFGHFSPVLRALDALLIAVDSGSWVVTRIVAMALYAATIAAAMFVVRWVMGRTWGALVLCTLFGQSLFFMRLLGWWSATSAILPATLFMLLALGCALRWTERQRWWWLTGTLLAFALALCDYEMAMVFPVYLVLIRLLVMEDDLSPRQLWRVVFNERWLWVGVIVLDGLALANFLKFYYSTSPGPSILQAVQFVLDAASAFIPALFGYTRYPATPPGVAVAVTVALLVAGAAVVLGVRRRSWRAVVALVISFAVAMLPIGFKLVRQVGIGAGEDFTYEQSAAFVMLVFTAFALSGRWGGPRQERVSSWLAGRGQPPARRWLLAIAVLALAGFGVDYAISARDLGRVAFNDQPIKTEAFVHRFLSSAGEVRTRLGHPPSVLDRVVPEAIMPPSYVIYNDAAVFFGLFHRRVRFNVWDPPLYEIADSGALVRQRTEPVAHGRLAGAKVVPGPQSAVSSSGSAVCVRSSVPVSVRVSLAETAGTRSDPGPGGGMVVVLRYRAPAKESASVLGLLRNGSPVNLGAGTLTRGAGAISLALPAATPGGSPIHPVSLQIVLAPRVCLTGAALVATRPAG
jgi:hypothetical protein